MYASCATRSSVRSCSAKAGKSARRICLRKFAPPQEQHHAAGEGNSFLGETDFHEAKRKFEIAYLKRKLEEHRWNVSQTAAEIGLQRQSLQEKLRELGIQRPGK
jgi:DNA-binding NtrC family response regulator